MTTKAKANGRLTQRREIQHLEVTSVSLLENLSKLSRRAVITNASTSGFLLVIKREDLVPAELRKNLTLESLIGSEVLIYLSQLNIEVSGRVARTKLLGKQGFELGIDYSEDAPEYWRECLIDLLPSPGEFD
jgi:hypothetical protein